MRNAIATTIATRNGTTARRTMSHDAAAIAYAATKPENPKRFVISGAVAAAAASRISAPQ